MRVLMAACVVAIGLVGGSEVDYPKLWESAIPFPTFLENAKARRDQWHSRFADAAIEAEALNEARALSGKRRILAVAEDRCSDSAWNVPYLAKLAAAVPEKIELRVISAKDGQAIQEKHRTPDGRKATPTIVVLDEESRFIGAWVERPAELQAWYLEHKESTRSEERYEHLNAWYTKDAGRTTIREVLSIMRREPAEAK